MGLKKGGKRTLGVRIFLVAVLTFFSLLIFVKSADFTATPSSINVNEDASNLYNFTIDNTDTAEDIVQANITLPANFIFSPGSDGTSAATSTFSNSSEVLTWEDPALITFSTGNSFWFNATAVNPGVYNMTITTLDSTSAINSTNISVTINDVTPPNITINSPSNQSYNTNSILFNVTSNDNVGGSNCLYSLDSGLNNFTMTNFSTSPNDYTATNSTMAQGSQTVIFYCKDSSNNLNSSSVTFFIDSIIPQISIVSPINNSNISDANIDIEYVRSDANLQSCWYSNDTYLVNTTIASCGNITSVIWSEGLHNVRVYANDSLGNLNFSTVSFTIDTIQPTISISFPSLNNTNNSNINLDINFTSSDSGSGLFNFWYSNDTYSVNKSLGVFGTYFNITNLTWSEGDHNVRIWANDSAGNYNFASISFTIDSVNPNIAVIFPTNNSNLSSNTISVNYTVADLNLKSCWYSNDSYSINKDITCGQNISLTWSEGLHNLTVYSNDTANNMNQSTISFTIDTIAPSAILNFPAQGSNLSTSASATILNASVNDATSGVANVIFSVSNSSANVNYSSILSSGYFVNTTFDTRQLTEGQHNIRIYAYDNVGNLNGSISINFTIDNIIPTLNSSNITGAFFNGTNFIFSPANQDNLYDSIDIIMNASEIVDWGTTNIYNSSGDKVKFFFGPNSVTSNIETWDGNMTFTTDQFATDGKYTINTTITDSAENNNTLTSITIFVDNSPPAFSNIIINPSPPNEAQDVQLNATLTETNLITNVVLEFKGKNYSVSNNSNEYYFTITSGNYTAHDSINYTWKVNDSLGNYNVSQQQFTVANRAPSFINGPIASLNFTENDPPQQINLSFYFSDSDLEDANNLIFGPSSLQNFSTYSITNGVLTLAPSLGYSGITQVAFFANDSFNATYSNIVTINVTPVNHVPRTSLIPNITFNEDTYNIENNTLNLSNYFFDDDGTIVSYGTINQNNTGNLTISISNGLVNVTSALNWFGSASLYFTAMDDDNEFGVSRQIFIFANPVNDAPQINVPNATMLEDTTGNLNLSNYTTDVDSVVSSFVFYANPESAGKINCSASGNILTYQPTANFFGTTYCNVTASDGINNSSVLRFNISVTNVNDAPNITSSATTTAVEDVPYVYQINASDVDNLISPGTDNLTYSLLNSPTGMSIGSASGIIIWLPTNSNVGNSNVTFKADDGKNGTAIQSFILNVANVNDLPTVPSLMYPANQTTIFVNSTALNWSASSDDENNTITYHVFFSNSANPNLNKSTASASATISGLEHGQTYYWHVVSSDGIGNQTKTETRTFNVSLKNAPTITQYFPLTNLTINESNSIEFNITATDIDSGDVLIYNWTLNGASVGNTGNYNFTTNFSSAGTYDLTAKTIDSFGLTTERNWRIIVSNNNVPAIISFLPFDSTPVIPVNASQNLSISATDPNNDNLIYEWFVDGVSVLTNATSYVHSSNISGGATITVIVTDAANNSASKTWNVTSTNVPVTSGFSGTTTNLSNVNLSSVQNLALENNFGKIFFENQILNLTDALDLSDNVFVLNGIAAINSTNYPQLNKKAKITLKGLSYSTIPEIFYSNDFTNNPAQITNKCNFCNITEFAAAPTTNGTVTFEVEHFSSFKVAGSGNKFDFNSFKALELCKNGTTGNLSLSVNNPDSGDSFEIGNAEKVEVNVENADSEDGKNVIAEISLYNINDDSVEEEMKSASATIEEDGDFDFEFALEINKDINEEENYLIFAKAYEKGDEEIECVQDAVEVKIERAENKVIVKSAIAKPESVTPGESFEIFVTAENIGTDDENNVYAEIKSDELDILEKNEKFDLAESGREKTRIGIIQAKIPFDAKEGNYEITVSVVSGSERDEKKIILPVEKKQETKISQISGSSVIRLEKSSEAKYSKNLNTGFIVFLIAGIIILSALIIRRLRE